MSQKKSTECVPLRNSPCLCGSGLKFKRCCADQLPGSEQLGKRAKLAFAQRNYKAALLEVRADVTQYTIWHKRHTEPRLEAGVPTEKLLEIDIDALNDLVQQLVFCYEKLGLREELPATLEALRSNISDRRWQRKIALLEVIRALGPDWNRVEGRKEFRRLGNIDDETDVEIIQLYIDLFGRELSFSKLGELYDRIIRLAKDEGERLHYRAAKAVAFLVIGDEEGAKAGLEEAVSLYRSNRPEPEGPYAGMHFAGALSILGQLRQDQSMLDESIRVLESFLNQDVLTNIGRAEAWRAIAETHKSKSDWGQALVAYRKALSSVDSVICKVFVAECLIRTSSGKDAAKLIRSITPKELNDNEVVDYWFVLAVIAVESGDNELLHAAREGLKQLRCSEPIFEKRRSELLLAVIETQERGSNQTVLAKLRRTLAAGINSASAYVMLRPNVMGIGIDIGKIIQDVAKGNPNESNKGKQE